MLLGLVLFPYRYEFRLLCLFHLGSHLDKNVGA
jgi:hypothetical protein